MYILAQNRRLIVNMDRIAAIYPVCIDGDESEDAVQRIIADVDGEYEHCFCLGEYSETRASEAIEELYNYLAIMSVKAYKMPEEQEEIKCKKQQT